MSVRAKSPTNWKIMRMDGLRYGPLSITSATQPACAPPNSIAKNGTLSMIQPKRRAAVTASANNPLRPVAEMNEYARAQAPNRPQVTATAGVVPKKINVWKRIHTAAMRRTNESLKPETIAVYASPTEGSAVAQKG